MAAIFTSLAIRNYRVYFGGALVSNIGNWLGRTATSWLVLVELSNGSASALGLVTAIMFAPQLFLAPLAGSVADKVSKRKILASRLRQAALGFTAGSAADELQPIDSERAADRPRAASA